MDNGSHEMIWYHGVLYSPELFYLQVVLGYKQVKMIRKD